MECGKRDRQLGRNRETLPEYAGMQRKDKVHFFYEERLRELLAVYPGKLF